MPKSTSSGYALVLAVTVLGLLVVLLVALSALTRLEGGVGEAADAMAQARADALVAVDVALGELQRYAGPDARLTATAAAFGAGAPTDGYVGVWRSEHTTGEPLTWLVSGNEQTPRAQAPDRLSGPTVELLGAGSVGTAGRIVAPLQPIMGSDPAGGAEPVVVGNYAWWVEDLGVKASLALPDREDPADYGPWADEATRRRAWQQSGHAPSWIEAGDDVRVGFDPLLPQNQAVLSRVLQMKQVAWLEGLGNRPVEEAWRERYFDFTTLTHGVLANTLPGDDPARGLLHDLSLAPELLGDAFAAYQALSYVEPPSAGNLALPPITTPASPRRRVHVRSPIVAPPAEGGPPLVFSVAPVLTEFLLQFRVDRVAGGVEVRSRLYVGLWNPYTTAMVPPAELRLSVRGLPQIEITDPGTGVSTHVDLEAGPFGPAQRSVALPFTAGSTPQTDRASWLPGRVYSWVTPTGSSPPHSLAFYNKTLNAAGWTVGTSSLGGTSANLAVQLPGVSGLEVELWHGSDLLATYQAPAFPAASIPDVEPPGQQLYWNWRFAYGFRLNQPSSTSLDRTWLITPGRDPRSRRLSATAFDPFSAGGGWDPAAAPAYVGTPATAAGFDHLLLYRVQGSALTSRSANYDPPVFELPRLPLLSLGELQHLQIEGGRPFGWGNSWGGAVNHWFDRCFFSGLSLNGAGPDLERFQALPQRRLVPVETRRAPATPFTLDVLRGASAAHGARSSRFLLQAGAFNVNSIRPLAWQAVLSALRFPAATPFRRVALDNGPTVTSTTGSARADDAWTDEPGREAEWGDEVVSSGAAFFRFPQTAQETAFTGTVPVLGPAELSRADFRRGVRSSGGPGNAALSAEQISRLADAIVRLVRLKHAQSGPFGTIEEFLAAAGLFGDQSLLERAMADAELNAAGVRPVAAVEDEFEVGFSSVTLTPADLLTALAPVLRVRSDTFLIRAYAETRPSAGGGVGARAWAEAVVQRGPEPVDPEDDIDQPAGPFGRRFRIISFRWLTPAEL